MSQTARTRLLTAGVLIAVFGTGILVGLVVDNELGATTPVASEVAEAEPTPEEPRSEASGERRYLYQQVGANESQLSRIDSIIQEHRARRNAIDEELKQVEAEFQVDYRANLLNTREAIKSVLLADQAAEYQRLLDEWDARQAEREDGDEKD